MSIRRNATYNIVGATIPLVLSLVTVPIYLKLIGAERYGVLAIAWLMLGYFGRLDLGLGRATSFRMAMLRDASPDARANAFWAALAVNSTMGAAGAVIFLAVGAYFFGHWFKVAANLKAEVLAAVPLLALSVPVVTITGVLTGALEGRERFLSTNTVSTASNAIFQLAPLLLAWLVGPNLVGLLAAALSSRVLALIVLGVLCHREIIGGRRAHIDRREAVTLLKFGGWVNIVSVFGPLMQVVDRFAIGAIVGSVAVTIYTIPFQLAQRFAVLPASLTNAAFPRMSAATADERDALAERALAVMLGMMSLPILAGIYLMEPFLNIWIGPQLGVQSAPVGRILLIAYWLNAFALVPFVKLQASGRPDIVAKFVLAEVPVYLVGLYLSLKYGGYEACAAVFAARCLSDYLWLNGLSARRIPNLLPQTLAFGLLLLALYSADSWPSILDWRWWASASVLALIVGAISWRSTPADLQRRIIGLPPVRAALGRLAERGRADGKGIWHKSCSRAGDCSLGSPIRNGDHMLDAGFRNYLDLMKMALTASLYEESGWKIVPSDSPLKRAINRVLGSRSLLLVKKQALNRTARDGGKDWPMFGFTMAGTKRLENVEDCIAEVIAEKVPGDFVECGVWRGGSSIFARAAFDAYGGKDRTVWLADSFEGMPARSGQDMADPELKGTTYLEVSLEDVKSNFDRFGLLDDRVKFIKGWFSDTLSTAPVEKISILRLDGDYYSSTMDALNGLYDKVSVGGYIIIDDYNAFASCKAAVTEFCASKGFQPQLHPIDEIAVYWRREPNH